MSQIKPFKALRPTPALAEKVASPPYDVLSSEEAREQAKDNPYSFLHIVKSEIDLPENVPVHSPQVYERAASNLDRMEHSGVLVQDKRASLYLYQQTLGNHTQTGIVGLASCLEYQKGLVRIHEYTRPDKEEDRVQHIANTSAQTGPVFLTYHAVDAIDQIVQKHIEQDPEISLKATDGTFHKVWHLPAETTEQLVTLFQEKVELLYIADGHHRSASANRVSEVWRDEFNLHEDHTSQFFLSVVYPHNQMQILPYNRHVHDLNGLTEEEFLARCSTLFSLKKTEQAIKPEKHEFSMFLANQWYHLQWKTPCWKERSLVEALDVSLLQKEVLQPWLGIDDPRRSERISFVGGIRGTQELEKLVKNKGGVAFLCCPTSIEELFAVADANQVMPPKSTWFEPKLKSGLFVHKLEP